MEQTGESPKTVCIDVEYQTDSGTLTIIDLEVPENATDREIEMAARNRLHDEVEYGKLSFYYS